MYCTLKSKDTKIPYNDENLSSKEGNVEVEENEDVVLDEAFA